MELPTTGLPVLREAKKQEPPVITTQRRIKGLTLFSYNQNTGEIKPVYGNKITMEDGYLYVQALNIKNAKRKLGIQDTK